MSLDEYDDIDYTIGNYENNNYETIYFDPLSINSVNELDVYIEMADNWDYQQHLVEQQQKEKLKQTIDYLRSRIKLANILFMIIIVLSVLAIIMILVGYAPDFILIANTVIL